MAALTDVADLIMGQSPPSSTYNEGGDGLAFFQGKADFGFRHPTPRLFCNAPLKIAKPHDILMSVRAPVGPTNIADRECCIGRGLAAIRPRDIDGDFLFFNLRYIERFIASLGSGSTFHAISKSQLAAVEVNPHKFGLPDQRKIAAVLGVVQRAIEQQEHLLALTAELKKTLLHQLFTQGLRGEPQKQTDIGPVPESWEVVELGNLATKISKGSSPRWQGFEYVPEGVLFVRSQNVGFGRMEFSDRVFVPTRFNEHEKRSILKNEDILINLVGASIGRVALGTPEIEGANCNQAVGFARLEGDRSFKAFIVYYLLSPIGQRQMFFQKKDIARANLSLLDLRSFKVPVPSPEETAEIAQILDKTERKIEISDRTKTALSDLFRILLHQLMTAQIRVHDLDLNELGIDG